jgi:hypothetical protein
MTYTSTSIRLRGDVQALFESSTFLVWLSTAIRAAPLDQIAYCTPELQRTGTASCRVTYNYEYPSFRPSARCWYGMVRNPVIANGYPVTPRSTEERGLEIPFSMMTVLAQTPYLTLFEGATILKGFTTILSLINQAGTLFTWHFLINRDRKRMPYTAGLEVTETHLNVKESDMQAGRHFVGWSPCVDMLAGVYCALGINTIDVPYALSLTIVQVQQTRTMISAILGNFPGDRRSPLLGA